MKTLKNLKIEESPVDKFALTKTPLKTIRRAAYWPHKNLIGVLASLAPYGARLIGAQALDFLLPKGRSVEAVPPPHTPSPCYTDSMNNIDTDLRYEPVPIPDFWTTYMAQFLASKTDQERIIT